MPGSAQAVVLLVVPKELANATVFHKAKNGGRGRREDL
jgi:hypothetical protein